MTTETKKKTSNAKKVNTPTTASMPASTLEDLLKQMPKAANLEGHESYLAFVARPDNQGKVNGSIQGAGDIAELATIVYAAMKDKPFVKEVIMSAAVNYAKNDMGARPPKHAPAGRRKSPKGGVLKS